MNWLAVDTAMNACGVAVKRADGRLFTRTEPMDRGQAERLMPLILEMLAEAGLTLPEIDSYAIATGPGTFTGLRVGLATIRALAQISGKPAIGVGTFDAIADSVGTFNAIADSVGTFDAIADNIREEGPVCILIETKRTDYYVRAPGIEDGCIAPADLKTLLQPGWLLVGDAVERAKAETGCTNKTLEIKSVPLDALIGRASQVKPAGLPEPVYLRGADVSVARRKPARIV